MASGIVRNSYITLAILFVTGLCAVIVIHQKAIATSEPSSIILPDTFGQWRKIKDIAFEKEVIEILGTHNVVGSMYVNPQKRVIQLTVVHAINNRAAFHPPEYCLTGSGSELIEQRLDEGIPNGMFSVNEMVFLNDSNKKLFVWNWYAASKKMTPNYYWQQWLLFRDQIFFGRGIGTVVNIYTEMDSDDGEEVRHVMIDFARSMLPVLNSIL